MNLIQFYTSTGDVLQAATKKDAEIEAAGETVEFIKKLYGQIEAEKFCEIVVGKEGHKFKRVFTYTGGI